jgi:integrase
MANIKKIDNKDGLSYKITVFSGRDAEGKQIRHYMTYVPPKTWSEQRAYKEATKQATLFEDSISKGYDLDNHQSFAEYAQYVLNLKLRSKKLKESTYERYIAFLNRINPEIGHLKLADIRPAHLNYFYEKLSKDGSRQNSAKAVLKADFNLSKELKKRKLTKQKAAEICKISASTVTLACRGVTIEIKKADKIADLLGVKTDKVFNIERDMEPLSDKTILEHHHLISSVLGKAEEEMLVPYNAAAKATPPQPKRHEPNYFQPETVYKILDAVESESIKYRTFVKMLIVTGCRRGEISGLKWNKIDFNTGVITIDCGLYYSTKRGVYEGSTKTNEQRTITIPMEVISLLKQLHHEQAIDRINSGDRWNETGYVFTRDDGWPVNPDTWNSWLKKFAEKNNLPHINPHAFRHTVASVLISNGVDVTTASKLLGHSNVTTTQDFYSHIIEEAKETATKTLTDVLLKRKA